MVSSYTVQTISNQLNMIYFQGNILSCDQGWVPLQQAVGTGQIHAVSLSYLVENQDEAVIWRGPKKTAMIRQFIEDVCWGNLDFLIIDTPPGKVGLRF